MNRRYAFVALVAFVVAADAVAWGQGAGGGEVEFARDRLEIASGTARHRFAIELATTPEQRARGLMFREELAADAGMLFIFEAARPVSFWMKNTLVSLDMLFIAPDGRIVAIAPRTTPLSEEPVPSGVAVLGVLEVVAGTAQRLGLAVGDRVIHPSFGGAS